MGIVADRGAAPRERRAVIVRHAGAACGWTAAVQLRSSSERAATTRTGEMAREQVRRLAVQASSAGEEPTARAPREGRTRLAEPRLHASLKLGVDEAQRGHRLFEPLGLIALALRLGALAHDLLRLVPHEHAAVQALTQDRADARARPAGAARRAYALGV